MLPQGIVCFFSFAELSSAVSSLSQRRSLSIRLRMQEEGWVGGGGTQKQGQMQCSECFSKCKMFSQHLLK